MQALPGLGSRAAPGCRRPGSPSTLLATNAGGFLRRSPAGRALADRLQTTGAQLVDASVAIEDLRQFNAHVIDSLVSGLATADAGLARADASTRAAAAITGAGQSGIARSEPGRARRCWRLPAAFRRTARTARAVEASGRRADFAYGDRRAAARPIDLELRQAAPLHVSRTDAPGSPLHVPGRHRREAPRARCRPARAAGGGRARWPPASRTRSAIRWPRCRAPFRSCARSCRSTRSRRELMDIVLRESDAAEPDDPVLPGLRASASGRRSAGCDLGQVVRDTARAAAERRRRACRATASRCDVPTGPGLVRDRREPGAADRMEPGHQRPAGDGRRRTPVACR